MSLVDFIKQYYIDPIILNQGYNFVNTLTYAILVVLATYATFKFLKRYQVKLDKNFVTAVITLVVFGTMTRLLQEAGIVVSYFLVTPMIWIEMFVLIYALFFISKFVERRFRIPYYKTLTSIGIFLSLILLALITTKIAHYKGVLIALGILIPPALILYFIKWKPENKLVTMAHILDAVATFTAIQFFGFRELHVVPRLLIEYFNPVSFIIVKVLVVIGILILIDKNSEDRDFNNFLKLAIAIIGLAPGIRDLVLLGLSG